MKSMRNVQHPTGMTTGGEKSNLK